MYIIKIKTHIYNLSFTDSFGFLYLELAALSFDLLAEVNNFLEFLNFRLVLLELTRKLVDHSYEHHAHAEYLHGGGLVMVEKDADKNSHDLPGRNHEWYYMLFELLNHSVYEKLTQAAHQ